MVAMRRSVLLLGSLGVASGTVYFSETFGDGWESRWTLSTWKDSEKEKMGKWVAATGKWFGDAVEDQGIQTAEIMKFYSISAPFASFSNEGKELVIQYQAKYEKDLSCGGGYLKVGPTQENLSNFGDPTPYNIMFGPDQCNTDKRTHLIFNYNDKNFLKKAELPFKQEGEGTSHLYRLVLKPNSTVRVEVDQEKIYEGPLAEDWEMLPAKELPDPNDKKPADWVEESQMADPDDAKPADWVDEKRIVDSNSTKPDEWDDEEDGEWEPPQQDNPAFKGEWVAKRIPNSAYQGAWFAKTIANPDFVDNPDLYKYSDFGYVGFDVYQVKGGTIFDNVIITDSIAEADSFAQKWKTLSEAEKVAKKKTDDVADDKFAKMRAARAARPEHAKFAEAAKASEDKKKDGDEDAPTARVGKGKKDAPSMEEEEEL